MASERIKINGREIQKYLDGGNGVEAMLDERAKQVADAVRSNAPVVSGTYRDSVTIETAHTDRMVKRIVADVPYAAAVEANTGTLARSLDAGR